MAIPPSGVDATPAVRATPRRRRRPSLLVAAVLVAAGGLAPAGAAEPVLPPAGSAVEFVAPTPQAGVAVTGAQRVRALATTLGIVRSVEVVIRADDPSIPPYEAHSLNSVPIPRQAAAELAWNTAGLSHNGRYRFEARAQTCTTTCGVVENSRPGILVANPPAVPAGVRAAFRDKVPVVTWTRGPEPDLLGYRVLRGATPVGSVRAGKPTEFADTAAPTGVGLSYSVVAVRRSPVAATADACGPFDRHCAASEPSAATSMIAIPTVTTTGPTAPPATGGTTAVTVTGPDAQPAPAAPAAPTGGATTTAPATGSVRTPARSVGSSPAAGGGTTAATDPAGAPDPSGAPAQDPAPAGTAPAIAGVEPQGTAPGAPSGTTTRALDRVETAADRTATVVTLVLLVLGLLGAFKAKRILRASR